MGYSELQNILKYVILTIARKSFQKVVITFLFPSNDILSHVLLVSSSG